MTGAEAAQHDRPVDGHPGGDEQEECIGSRSLRRFEMGDRFGRIGVLGDGECEERRDSAMPSMTHATVVGLFGMNVP